MSLVEISAQTQLVETLVNLRCGFHASVLIASCLVMMTGCGQQKHINEMSKPAWTPKKATWPELEALFRNSDGSSAGLNMEKLTKNMSPRFGGGVANTKELAKDLENPEFQARLKAFADAPIPAEFQNSEREAAKKELLEGFNKMLELTKKGDASGVMKQHKANSEIHKKIVTIPGQTPPTGAEAAKYAPPGG